MILSDTLDVSNYDYDTFDTKCLKESGIKRVIFGCWDLEKTGAMIDRSLSAGLIANCVYCFIYYGLDWESREVDNAVTLRRAFPMERAFLDCESHWRENTPTEARAMTVGQRVVTTGHHRSTLKAAGYAPGIYTGYFWWRDNMGDSELFKDDPLWLAWYGKNDGTAARITDLEAAGIPFGGWRRASIHQFCSTVGLCGRDSRDWNYYGLESEDGLSQEQYDSLLSRIERMELAGFSGGEEAAIARDKRIANAQYRAQQIADPTGAPKGQEARSLAQQVQNLGTRTKALETSAGVANAVLYGVPVNIINGTIERGTQNGD